MSRLLRHPLLFTLNSEPALLTLFWLFAVFVPILSLSVFDSLHTISFIHVPLVLTRLLRLILVLTRFLSLPHHHGNFHHFLPLLLPIFFILRLVLHLIPRHPHALQ